jgi:hypothetical protein
VIAGLIHPAGELAELTMISEEDNDELDPPMGGVTARAALATPPDVVLEAALQTRTVNTG